MKTKAWGWLMAGVVAAGLNALYHDGGTDWARRVVERVEHSSAAVLALASGRADAYLTQTRLLTMRDETAASQWATALAQVETKAARTQTSFARFETLSARQEARLARVEENRARIETQVAAKAACLRAVSASFDDDDFSAVTAPACPRLRLTAPQPPRVHVRVPRVHIEALNIGPA